MRAPHEDEHDPFYIGNIGETHEERVKRLLGAIPEEAQPLFDKRMMWEGADALVLRVRDVLEDYYTILSECYDEEIDLDGEENN